jgi:hypothetical protein
MARPLAKSAKKSRCAPQENSLQGAQKIPCNSLQSPQGILLAGVG